MICVHLLLGSLNLVNICFWLTREKTHTNKKIKWQRLWLVISKLKRIQCQKCMQSILWAIYNGNSNIWKKEIFSNFMKFDRLKMFTNLVGFHTAKRRSFAVIDRFFVYFIETEQKFHMFTVTEWAKTITNNIRT